ncbi:MAG: hypothetical protein EZS28_016466 [Streblomastix strix]|uniref:Uncharacterized protein n=1 Tax=Streblomastix strix TaxID=222440 RepID=A0A5J4VZB7_9EUKA|nr:MAG: hypothetical protein EZS28_016466 [Streblomastix strix]
MEEIKQQQRVTEEKKLYEDIESDEIGQGNENNYKDNHQTDLLVSAQYEQAQARPDRMGYSKQNNTPQQHQLAQLDVKRGNAQKDPNFSPADSVITFSTNITDNEDENNKYGKQDAGQDYSLINYQRENDSDQEEEEEDDDEEDNQLIRPEEYEEEDDDSDFYSEDEEDNFDSKTQGSLSKNTGTAKIGGQIPTQPKRQSGNLSNTQPIQQTNNSRNDINNSQMKKDGSQQGRKTPSNDSFVNQNQQQNQRGNGSYTGKISNSGIINAQGRQTDQQQDPNNMLNSRSNNGLSKQEKYPRAITHAPIEEEEEVTCCFGKQKKKQVTPT